MSFTGSPSVATPAVVHVESLAYGEPARVAEVLQRRGEGFVWLDGDGSRDGQRTFMASDPVRVVSASLGDGEPWAVLDALTAELESNTKDVREGLRWAFQTPRWIGFIAYDAVWSGARRSRARFDRASSDPVLWFARYDAVFVWDHAAKEAWVVADDAESAAALKGRARDAERRSPAPFSCDRVSVSSRERHERAIERAQEEIARGTIYQINLARRWEADVRGSTFPFWCAMREASSVPLGVYLNAGDLTIASRTMERFLKWDARHRKLETKPIKGTIPRSARGEARDEQCLLDDEKERAEHAMIVDLMRNDLGIVAEPGSVRIRDLLRVEPYVGLSHLVSTIECRTREGISIAGLLGLLFPPGSISGTPKESAIDWIERLEECPRGLYTGVLGYIDRVGGFSLAVAIRTAVRRGDRLSYFAGGGIVEASVPSKEVVETEVKAEAFLNALARFR